MCCPECVCPCEWVVCLCVCESLSVCVRECLCVCVREKTEIFNWGDVQYGRSYDILTNHWHFHGVQRLWSISLQYNGAVVFSLSYDMLTFVASNRSLCIFERRRKLWKLVTYLWTRPLLSRPRGRYFRNSCGCSYENCSYFERWKWNLLSTPNQNYDMETHKSLMANGNGCSNRCQSLNLYLTQWDLGTLLGTLFLSTMEIQILLATVFQWCVLAQNASNAHWKKLLFYSHYPPPRVDQEARSRW